MASYLNAHHLNTRFKVMICALAIASVTERTCVLSIISVVTFIRITQGIRNGGCKLTFLQARGKLLLLQGLRSISTASGRSRFWGLTANIWLKCDRCGAIGSKVRFKCAIGCCLIFCQIRVCQMRRCRRVERKSAKFMKGRIWLLLSYQADTIPMRRVNVNG